MKRSSLGRSDPLLDVYSREFRSMMEGVDEEEFGGGGAGNMAAEKKRRLGVHQVKALEKYFDMENKLEPDRKVKLAQELGLQPRQVAIWFQNRRARWKTKQLERDYGVLKSNYDSLKLTCDTLQHDNQALLKQIRELKEKVNNGERKVTVKEEAVESFSDEKSKPTAAAVSPENETGLNFAGHFHGGGNASIFSEFKDWSSDSDSSAILNEDNNNSPNAAAAVSPSAAAFLTAPDTAHQFSEIPRNILGDSYDSQFVKIEEHNFFGGCEEPCTILLSEQQAPAFHWGCPEDWNWEDE